MPSAQRRGVSALAPLSGMLIISCRRDRRELKLSKRRLNSYRWIWRIALCLLLSALSLPGHCSEEGGLYVDISSERNEEIIFSLDEAPPNVAALTQSIEQCLGGTLEDARVSRALDGRWLLAGHCDGIMRHKGASSVGQVNPTPLMTVLRKWNVPLLQVYIVHPNTASVSLTPAGRIVPERNAKTGAYYYYVTLEEQTAPAIVFRISVSPESWLGICIPLAIVLLLPIALTLWARRNALSAKQTDPTAVWFGYLRFSRGVIQGMWLCWMELLFATHLSRYLKFLTGSARSETDIGLFSLVALVPPVLTQLICSGLAHPIYARIRGMEWTRGDLITQTFWRLAYRLLPLGLLLTALGAGIDQEPRRAVLWIVVAFLSWQFCAQQYLRTSQLTLLAITFGELRDHIFRLAAKANVKIQQVYLLPAGKGRLANAYAM